MKRRVLLLSALLPLAGCGGGLYFEIGPDDDPPSVSLAAGATSAAAGQVVRLTAAASDDDHVTEVRFFRIDPSGATVYLGADGSSPYDWDAVVPANAVRGSTLRFYARAYDSFGQWTDSASVSVGVA